MSIQHWTIPGACDMPIIGDTHLPDTEPQACVLLAHGFKGYKDYGMFPYLARTLADCGFVAHRFNFSHSGMTNAVDTFARPDLFENDTWGKQIHDVHTLMRAVRSGRIEGGVLPIVLFGHSRGGVTVLLAALDAPGERSLPRPSLVVAASAPDRCDVFSEEDRRKLLGEGKIASPSARTGQTLYVGKAFAQELIDNPDRFDLPARLGDLPCPALIVHGEKDPTVDHTCSDRIADHIGAQATLVKIPTADHVFNTPNPMPADAEPSAELKQLGELLCEHTRRAVEIACPS